MQPKSDPAQGHFVITHANNPNAIAPLAAAGGISPHRIALHLSIQGVQIEFGVSVDREFLLEGDPLLTKLMNGLPRKGPQGKPGGSKDQLEVPVVYLPSMIVNLRDYRKQLVESLNALDSLIADAERGGPTPEGAEVKLIPAPMRVYTGKGERVLYRLIATGPFTNLEPCPEFSECSECPEWVHIPEEEGNVGVCCHGDSPHNGGTRKADDPTCFDFSTAAPEAPSVQDPGVPHAQS